MAVADIMAALVLDLATDINHHFTVVGDSLADIDMSAADKDISVVDTGQAVIEGIVVHTGAEDIETSAAGIEVVTEDMVVIGTVAEAAIIVDEDDIDNQMLIDNITLQVHS